MAARVVTAPSDGSVGQATVINNTTVELTYAPDGGFVGADNFQLQVYVRGDPPFSLYEQGVGVAAWGRTGVSTAVSGARSGMV